MIDINGLQINLVATLIATVAFFLLGFIWYTLLFAKPWMREMGYDPGMRPNPKAMLRGIFLLLLGSFMFCWVMAFYFAGWKLLPGSPEEFGKIPFAINCALSVILGFFIPINLGRVVWERHSWKLFFINLSYHSAGAVVVGIILVF